MLQIMDGPPPTVSFEKINQKINEGDPFYIKCNVESLTPCKIILKHETQQLKRWNSK